MKLPSVKYLRLHAACCQVEHMSRAAGYLEKVDEDRDEHNVLAPCGELAGMLAAAPLTSVFRKGLGIWTRTTGES